MRVLLTGGLGYIGSHTAIELIAGGHEPLIIDNLENSTTDVLESIERFTGTRPAFEEIDIRDWSSLSRAMGQFQPEAIVHFAAKKDPQESIEKPLDYYDANVSGSINLIKCAREHSTRKFVFSSSAAVYGHAKQTPISEDHPLEVLSPYARTKHIGELMIEDVFSSQAGASAFILRYFNPVGTHQSGALIAHHKKAAKNLFPALMRAVQSRTEVLTIHGRDLPTPDGTGIRDYIHVQDLAAGHVAALECLDQRSGVEILNVGTGRGYSVREVIETCERALGRRVPYQFGPPREGDPAVSFAETLKSVAVLNWAPRLKLEDMLLDEWRAFSACGSDRSTA